MIQLEVSNKALKISLFLQLKRKEDSCTYTLGKQKTVSDRRLVERPLGESVGNVPDIFSVNRPCYVGRHVCCINTVV